MQEGNIKPETVAKAFGQTLRDFRVDRGLSQELLAHESNLDRTYISMLERGIKQPSLTALFRLALALDASATEMVDATRKLLGEGR